MGLSFFFQKNKKQLMKYKERQKRKKKHQVWKRKFINCKYNERYIVLLFRK